MMPLRLAIGLLKGQASRAWLFIFCLAVGVAARVSVGSFLASLDQSLGQEARSLLGADLELSGSAPLAADKQRELAVLAPEGARLSERVSLLSMASAQGPQGRRSRLVELEAVDAAYPLVGALRMEAADGRALDAGSLQSRPWAVVQPELLGQLGVAVGAELSLGRQRFVIAGLLREEPGLGAGAFSLGPRALIGLPQLKATALTGFGSRASFETLVRLPETDKTEPLAAELRARWKIQGHGHRGMAPPEGTIRLRTPRDAQNEVRGFFERLADYLSLVSLMALLLGGVGVASIARGFVREASVSSGVLRSLGASPGAIRAIFAWQAALLGLLGGLIGAGAGVAIQALLPELLASFLPVSLQAAFSAKAIAWGLGLGLFTALVFGLDPVLASAQQSTAALLRDEDPTGRSPWSAWAWRGGAAVLFALLAAWEARSWTRGPGAFGAVLAGALCLQGAGLWLLPRLARGQRLKAPFALRHALANLGRPGLRAGSSLVALGSAALLLGVLAVYQHSLLAELDPGARSALPDLFVIDIQRDQVEPLKGLIASKGAGIQGHFSPMVRARYRGKLGEAPPRKVPDGIAETREDEDGQRMRSREQNLSWRAALGPGETLAAGRWMDPNGEEAEASLEEWYAQRLGVKLGDVLRFDVQGVEVQAKLSSLRKVRWASFQPNFFVLLSPWTIQDAPQTWIASLSGVGDPQKRADLQAAIVQRFPNLTLFDVAEGTVKILGILDKIQAAVRMVAWFCLATGLIVLAGLGLASARSRRSEAALLKVLGADRGTLLSSALLEFGLLSGLAAALGLLLSLAFGWVLLVKVLELSYAPPWATMLGLGALFTATGGLVGLAATARAYRASPAETLRED